MNTAKCISDASLEDHRQRYTLASKPMTHTETRLFSRRFELPIAPVATKLVLPALSSVNCVPGAPSVRHERQGVPSWPFVCDDNYRHTDAPYTGQ